MVTKIIIKEAKKFPGFHHVRGKVRQRSNEFSFRASCNKDNFYKLFLKRGKEQIDVKALPIIEFGQLDEVLNWIAMNFNYLKLLRK
jgi:hypothetical protein